MSELANIKVCFLAGTLGQGGAERQLFLFLRELRRHGARPRLLSLGRNELWEEPIKALGVPVTWVGQSKRRFKRLIQIVRELRRDPPAVFQSQHFYTNGYAVAAARMLGLSEIGAMQNDGISEIRDSGRIGGWVNFRGPKLMTVVSEAGIQYALSNRIPAARLYSMPTLMDTEQFKPTPRAPDKTLRLLSVGRLHPQKRMDVFLSVVARLRRTTHREIKATIAGGGPLRGALEQQAKELGLLPHAVEFLGPVSNIAPIYHQADICVLTSDHEGLPNVVLEAMASGLAVVATRVGGVPQVLRDGESGFLVPVGDEKAIASAILRLSNDPELHVEMGRRGRAFIEDNYSLARLPGLLQGLYSRALN